MFIAKHFDNFLDNDQVNLLLDLCLNTDQWRRINNSVWDNRTINFYTLINEQKFAPTIKDILKRTQNIIKQEYGLDDIYADTIDLCRWFPESNQPPHCDNMFGTNDHAVNKHRDFGCIIYLNDDYGGGETYYPDNNCSIKPKAGKLAIHPADCNHRHGVKTVKDKIRYTVASFWTTNFSKSLKYVDWANL